MTLDRQAAAAAERRRPALTIATITPARTTTASRIQSQIKLEPDPLPAAGDPLGWTLAVAVEVLGVADGVPVTVTVTPGLGETLGLGLGETLGVGLILGLGDELVLCPDEALALLVGARLAIALRAPLPHPASMHPAVRIAASRARPLAKRRMADPSARPGKKAASAASSH